MSIVLDASMAIAWLFSAKREEMSRIAVRRIIASGGIVPAHWKLEIANVLLLAIRTGRCRRDYADRSLERLTRLRLEVDQETDRQAWGETRRLAREHKLTMYDAAYLELAMRSKAALASLDRALLLAAKRAGLEVLVAE
jgi:predicted nucleic acid-binding protein